MSNAPREWPNKMKSFRDRAAESACDGIKALLPLLKQTQVTREEEIRRIAMAVNHFQDIARLLEAAGAPTEPIEPNLVNIWR